MDAPQSVETLVPEELGEDEDLFGLTLQEIETALAEGRVPVLPAPEEWLRLTVDRGQRLLDRVEQGVSHYELEMGYHGEAFNLLLERTGMLDKKISLLSEMISSAKLGWAKASMEALQLDLRQVSQQLKIAQTVADDEDRARVTENLAILRDNLGVAHEERDELQAIGVATSELDRHIVAMEAALAQLEAALEQGPGTFIRRLTKGALAEEMQSLIGVVNQRFLEVSQWLGAASDDMEISVQLIDRERELGEAIAGWQEQREAFAEAGLDVAPLERFLAALAKGAAQLGRLWQGSMVLSLSQLIDEQLRELNEQVGYTHEVESLEDVEALKGNCEVFEANVMEIAQQVQEIPTAMRGEVAEHLGLLIQNWQRLEQAIGEAEQQIAQG